MLEDIINLNNIVHGVEAWLMGGYSILEAVYNIATTALNIVLAIVTSSMFAHILGVLFSVLMNIEIVFILLQIAFIAASIMGGGSIFDIFGKWIDYEIGFIRLLASVIMWVFQLLSYMVGAIAGNIPGL